MSPFWRPDIGDLEHQHPEMGPLTFVGSGGWKYVYSFHRDGKRLALLTIPLPGPHDFPEPQERNDIGNSIRARVKREVKTLLEVKVPTLVKLGPVYDTDNGYFEDAIGGRKYLWFTEEFVDGEPLNRLVTGDRPEMSQLGLLLLDILDCIAAFSKRQIIHRDIKPSNIIRVRDGSKARFVLLDAGVALDQLSTPLTAPGQQMGTRAYMSPEQLAFKALDWRSDLFALGITVFEYAAGRHPFYPPVGILIEHAIIHSPAPDLAAMRPDLPIAFCRLIRSMLQKPPHLRPGNIRNTKQVVQNILNGGEQ